MKTKRFISVMVVVVMVLALGAFPVSAEVGAFSFETGFDTDFDTTGNPFKIKTGTGAEVAETAGANGKALHINTTANTEVNCVYAGKKPNFNFTSEFRMKIVKNKGTIVINHYIGKFRSQLNITSDGKKLAIPARAISATANESGNKQVGINSFANADWHTWRIVYVNGIQTIYIDNTIVYNGYVQFNQSSDMQFAFYATANNEFYVDDFKFNEYAAEDVTEVSDEKVKLVKENFEDWVTIKPDNGIAEINNGILHLDSTDTTASKSVSAKYTESGVKYPSNVNTELKFRLRVPKFTGGTAIIKANYGYSRLYLELVSGGKTLRIKDSEVNKEVKLEDKIANYNPAEWHDFRVEKQYGRHDIYVDDVMVLSGYAQYWSDNFGFEFWANHSGTSAIELFVDDFSIRKTETIPTVIGKAEEIYNQETDDYEQIKWTGNGSGENAVAGGVTTLSSDEISLSKGGAISENLYANRGIPNTDRMLLEFDMEIPSYSLKNSVMLGNKNYRAELRFSPDSFGVYTPSESIVEGNSGAKASRTLVRVKANIGNSRHNWKVMVFDGIAKVYMDNNYMYKFNMYRTNANDGPILQISCQNSVDETAAMTLSNVKVRKLTGSVIVNQPEVFNFDSMMDETARASFKLENYSSNNKTATIVIAAYDNAGAFCRMQKENVSVGLNLVWELNGECVIDDKTVGTKAFVFSDFNTLTPYSDKADLLEN